MFLFTMILPEAFGDFCLANDESAEESKSNKAKCDIDPSEYVAVNHPSKWFLNAKLSSQLKDARELVYYRAACAYDEGNFEASLQKYKELLETGEHNNSHKFAIIDSIIRCGIKSSGVDPSSLLSLLHDQLLPLVASYGEQLQYWSLSLLVYKNSNSFFDKYLWNAILLCTTVDSSEHWTALANADLTAFRWYNPNFHLGCKCRALRLMRMRASTARSFVREKSIRMAFEMEKELLSQYSIEQVQLATSKMRPRIVKASEVDTNDSLPAPHECRLKGMFRDEKEQKLLISRFVDCFPFIFPGVQDVDSMFLIC